MRRAISALFVAAIYSASALFTPASASHRVSRVVAPVAPSVKEDGVAEARLLAIYQLIGQARTREALALAGQLVQTYPNFQLAQLVYGDLLSSQDRPLRALGDVPDTTAKAGAEHLAELREESLQRMRALRERPPAGAIPSQFLMLSMKNRHAIAVDASRSRLYLFENSETGIKLIADYYISVGKLGTDKLTEGDFRTPLGVYFITSSLNPSSLKDMYGAGALPINYPNPLDVRLGRSGSGIWLHGTPSAQYSRPPKSTDGCVVMSNPDLRKIISTVETRSTPVVITPQLQWVTPSSVEPERASFMLSLQAWRVAKSSGNLPAVLNFYTRDFNSFGKNLTQWTPQLAADLAKQHGQPIDIKNLSLLHWKNKEDSMVVTFDELHAGSNTGVVVRQYWIREGSEWKIFFEGIIG